jgi:ectoine hydroxylase-related dioxygenase (phytanoyl-CoA dioxygenase family)
MHAVSGEMEKYRAYMMEEISKRGLKSTKFCAKKGDVFIWHSQLFHGGSPIIDRKKTRKSLVTHYFKKGDLECNAVKQNEFASYIQRPHQPAKSI